MNGLRHLLHLCRRAITSFHNGQPEESDIEYARGILLEGEFDLWTSMQGRDKRHSLAVLRRFDGLRPRADRRERAAALLHDIGKVTSGLGWIGRVVATVVGPRTTAFRNYCEHERIGADLLEGISDNRTVDLVRGLDGDPASNALRIADEI